MNSFPRLDQKGSHRNRIIVSQAVSHAWCFKFHGYYRILPLLVLLFSGLTGNAQREVDLSRFSQAYYDSIRAIVYDTTMEHYSINAYRLNDSEEIIIDGRLDEEAWQKAEHRGKLLEKEPYPLVPMSDETEFAILHDDENIYIGVWCWESEPEKIIQRLSPRNNSGPDHLMLFIDSYNDHRTGYKFTVTPTGVQGDELRYDDVKRDRNWNGIWYSEGFVDERGWYAEVKIPVFNMRYSKQEVQTWGFNIMRNISKNASRGQWKPHLPEWDNTTRMSQLGLIENISNISSGRTFEIRPYGTFSSTETMDVSPFSSINIGGDIRYSPSPNVTADFTFNPDFAQVDADVFEINLTRFPTRFKELRPFFTERINVFNTPLELFYSRRIGSRGDILGGMKLTGKLDHGIEFGILGNLTGKSLFKSSMTNQEEALFGVMRVKKDILGSSSIGLLAAAKEEKEKFNRILGIDGSFVLNDKDLVDVQVASGETESGTNKHMAWNMSYLRTGDLFGWNLKLDHIEPSFEINRVGYIQKEPDRGWNRATGLFRISPRINKHHIRRIIANLEYEYDQDLFTSRYIDRWLLINTDHQPGEMFGTVEQDSEGVRHIYGGTRTGKNYRIGGDVTVSMINEMSFSGAYNYFTATELTGDFSGDRLMLNYATRPVTKGADFAGIFTAGGGTFYNFNQKYVGIHKSLSLDGQGRLSHNFLAELQGEITKTYDPGNDNDGKYYKISSNSTWMFTKDFFLRVHAQGIFGTTYYGQKESKNEYLLSGLLSWEYKPGSFLYLAYNEGRFDRKSPAGRKSMELKNRTLVVKLSYFFSV